MSELKPFVGCFEHIVIHGMVLTLSPECGYSKVFTIIIKINSQVASYTYLELSYDNACCVKLFKLLIFKI